MLVLPQLGGTHESCLYNLTPDSTSPAGLPFSGHLTQFVKQGLRQCIRPVNLSHIRKPSCKDIWEMLFFPNCKDTWEV